MNRTPKQIALDIIEPPLDWAMRLVDDIVDTYGRWLWPIALVACSLFVGALVAGAA